MGPNSKDMGPVPVYKFYKYIRHLAGFEASTGIRGKTIEVNLNWLPFKYGESVILHILATMDCYQ